MILSLQPFSIDVKQIKNEIHRDEHTQTKTVSTWIRYERSINRLMYQKTVNHNIEK